MNKSVYVLALAQEAKDFRNIFLKQLSPVALADSTVIYLESIPNAIQDFLAMCPLKRKDIICIIKIPCNTTHNTHTPFHSFAAAKTLRALRNNGIDIITGLGRPGQSFVIDRSANYAEQDATHAAVRLNTFLKKTER